MSVKQRGDRWIASVYDPQVKGQKKHLGVFDSEAEAQAVVDKAMKFKPMKCVGCGKSFRPRHHNQRNCKRNCGAFKGVDTVRSPACEAAPHWLYRCFDLKGQLLYVGITNRGMGRMNAHSKNGVWAGEVANISIEHFADRKSALLAEEQAIKRERPAFNVDHARPVGVAFLEDFRKEAC